MDVRMMQVDDPAHLKAAFELLGLREIVGSEHEPKVVQFFADAGHPWVKDDETAWCAAFANSMLGRVGIAGTGSLAARSFLQWGEPTDRPARGDLVVFKRGNSSWQGHVAFYLGETTTHVWVLGGNQKNSVSVAAYSKETLLGYRRPPTAADGLLRPGTMNSARVRTVQALLKRLGYLVGSVDGDFGNFTRDAVLAWKADNGLPLDPAVSPSDVDAMERSGPRPVSEARQSAKATEVAAVDPSVKHDTTAVKVAVGAATAVSAPTVIDVAGGLKEAKEALGQIKEAKGLLEQIVSGLGSLGIDTAAFVSSHSTLLLVCSLAFVLYFVLKSRKARVEDHREGRRL